MSVSREVHLVLHSLEELLCYLRARVVIETKGTAMNDSTRQKVEAAISDLIELESIA